MINYNPANSKVNLAEINYIIIIVVPKKIDINVRNWVIDFDDTIYIYISKNNFVSYTQIKEGEEIVYLWWFTENSNLLGKEKSSQTHIGSNSDIE